MWTTVERNNPNVGLQVNNHVSGTLSDLGVARVGIAGTKPRHTPRDAAKREWQGFGPRGALACCRDRSLLFPRPWRQRRNSSVWWIHDERRAVLEYSPDVRRRVL